MHRPQTHNFMRPSLERKVNLSVLLADARLIESDAERRIEPSTRPDSLPPAVPLVEGFPCLLRYNLLAQTMNDTRFGRLTVICRDTGSKCARNSYYICRCDCGGGASVRADKLREGSAKDCGGCVKLVPRKKPKPKKIVAWHGHTKDRKPSPEYRTWRGIKDRCLNRKNKDYPKYGAAGISVCPEWVGSFPRFLSDMGPKPTPIHSLDRIDGKRGYEPGNCRWATPKEQTLNTSRVKSVTINGIEYPSMLAASIELRVPYHKIYNAIKRTKTA